MRRFLFICLAVALFLGHATDTFAQNKKTGTAPKKNVGAITEFTSESFVEELQSLLNGTIKEESKLADNQHLCDEMQGVYSALDSKRQEQVLELYNNVLRAKMAPLPDIFNLTRTLVDHRKTNRSATLFGEWLDAACYFIDKTKKPKALNEFVSFSSSLLLQNKLFTSRTSKWRVKSTAPYSYRTTTNDLLVDFTKPIDLVYCSTNDSNTIYGTTGTYNYTDNEWHGHGGRLTWERTGLPNNVCFGELADYTAVVKFPKFSADSVRLTNTKYFPKPILGHVDEVLSTPMEPEKYNYPQFRSYQKDFKLSNILPEVDFEGSFMLHGSKFVTNDDKSPASMVFYRNGKRFLTVSSTRFTILPHMLTSERASVTMYLGEGDSLCNTGILVRYTTADRRVNMINNPKRNYYSPYTDSYHQLDIYCESINWFMDKDILEFSQIGQSNTQTFVTFESNRFYSIAKAREVQGIENISPVARVHAYMKAHDMKQDFSLASFCNFIKLDEAQTKLMIHTLSRSALVSYDEGKGWIHVNDKLIGFFKAISKSRGHDYDALTLESTTKEINAQLQLSTNELYVHGVEKFVVSDSQAVLVRPYGGEITVLKNRDINFSGRINCGRFVMNVTNATFLYKRFEFDLPQIDSLNFFVTSFTDPAKQQQVQVRTPLYNLVGNIKVDKPDNHCGLKKNKEYPIFNSVENSYVYYDKREIMNSVYKRDKFYYSLHPFTLYQLLDFETDSLEFNGVLTSAGIFPDIEKPLKVQRDYSLGFITQTPASGFEAYGGKGRYYQEIDLSYRGLRGRGKLEYLTATAVTDKYLFEPDSMMALTDSFAVKLDNIYPDIHNSQSLIRWYPYQDSMTVSQIKDGPRFKMYANQALLSGRVTLQPKGASAYGTVDIKEGSLRSTNFKLHPQDMDAAKTAFTLRSKTYNNIAFKADNMKSHVDYQENIGEFVSNVALERTQLPALGYAAEVDKFTWDWDHTLLALNNSKSESTDGLESTPLRDRLRVIDKMPGAHFTATDPKLEGLQFFAINSRYQYDALQLSCHNVFALSVADAVVAPSGDSLHISQGGVMDLIKQSQLLYARDNSYHLFYNADVLVSSGKKYSAKGTIDYVDEEEKHQPIYMDQIAPNAQGMSVANGTIKDSANFTLNAAFGFAGKVRIDADNPHYYFSGGVKLIHKCVPADQLGLLAYNSFCDPEDIRVEVPDTAVDWKDKPIAAALWLDKSAKPMPAFLIPQPVGVPMLRSYGQLVYDNEAQTYTIAPQFKIEGGNEVVDRVLTLHTDNCLIEGEGPISFGTTSDPVNIFAYGTAAYNPNNDEETTMQTVLGLNFPIDNTIVKMLASQIEQDLRLTACDRDNDLLRRALVFNAGGVAGQEAYDEYESAGAYNKIPKSMEATLLLENVRWNYAPVRGYTASCTCGLSHVGNKQLHLNVRVKAQLARKGGEMCLMLYLQMAGDHWYYFKYEYNAKHLSIASSVGEWNDKIMALAKEKRTVGDFTYGVTNSRTEITSFLNWFTQGDDEESSEDLDD